MPYDSVVIDGQTGTISLAAIKWLMRHGIPLFILDYNGTLLSSTLPREPVNGPLKIAQIEAYKDQTQTILHSEETSRSQSAKDIRRDEMARREIR